MNHDILPTINNIPEPVVEPPKKVKEKKEKKPREPFDPHSNIITDIFYCVYVGIFELLASFIQIIVMGVNGIVYCYKALFPSLANPKVDDPTAKKDAFSKESFDDNDKVLKPKKKSFFEMDLNEMSREIKIALGIYQKELERLEETRRKLQIELASPDAAKATTPKVYLFKVKDQNGKFINGKFTGFSKMDVNSFLLNEGYEVYSIENNKWIDFIFGESAMLPSRWKNKDLIFWLTQLSTYIKSGIPLTDSIKILMNQMGSKSKKQTMQAVAYELTLGNSFSNALEKQSGVFPPLLINMLKAAEATGDLEATLDDMASYYTEIDSTNKQMVSALTYPIIVSIFAIGVVVFIILYVVPQFTKIYESNGMTLTGLTKFIIDLSNFLTKNYSVMLLGIIAVVGTFIYCYKKIKAFRRTVQVILMKTPVIKDIIIYNEITVFTKTFASLLKNNVFITESIDILSKITNNEIYKEIMATTIDNIARGDKISTAFKDHWAVPSVAYYMIVTGESTGELAQMLDKVSQYYQEQHRAIVSNLKALIEPILIAGLAIVVGGIILAVIVPMFDMYGELAG